MGAALKIPPAALEPHEVAIGFPELDEVELSALAIDIAKHGLVNPIVLYEGKVLDGRARLKACKRASVDPRFFQFEGTDPVTFVLRANAGRSMTPGQRIIAAARLLELWKVSGETRQVSGETFGPDRAALAAQALGVSRASVFRARALLDAPEELAAVERGELRVNEALRRLAPKPKKSAKAVEQEAERHHQREVRIALDRLERVASSVKDLCANRICRLLAEDRLQRIATDLINVADGSAAEGNGG